MQLNNTLKLINLSKNQVNDENCIIISELVRSKNNLNEMYLHWNHISLQGADLIFNCLLDNLSLKVLDMSWNAMQGDVQNLCTMIENNTGILHFDLSYNKFNYNQCENISLSLLLNKTCIGFHFTGMHGIVDNRENLDITKIDL